MYDMPIFVDVFGKESNLKQLKILGKNGDSMETKLYSSISSGWRLIQPFFGSKLVIGLSYGGIPIKIFNFWDAPNFGLFNEFKNTLWQISEKCYDMNFPCKFVTNIFNMANTQMNVFPHMTHLYIISD